MSNRLGEPAATARNTPVFTQSLAPISSDPQLWQLACLSLARRDFERRKPAPSSKENERRATLMRFQLAMALAVSLILQGGAFAQDVDNAVKDTGHATAKATKDAAHGTAEAAEKTTDATGHVVKKSGKGIKKGTRDVGHGVKKGATKTADALK
jgi:hypothetical protein